MAQDPAEPPALTYVLEDPAGDTNNHCLVQFGGQANNPCDTRLLEAGLVGDSFVFRWTLSTLNFGPTGTPAGVQYRLTFTNPDGGAMKVQGWVTASGSGAGVGLSGDAAAVSGQTVEVDRAAATVTVTFPTTSVPGAVPGAALTITSIDNTMANTGGVSTTAAYWTNVDTIASPPLFVIPGETASETPVLDLINYYNVSDLEFTIASSLEAVTQTEVYNWTSPITAGFLNYTAAVLDGNATITINDGAGLTVLSALVAKGTNEIPLENVTAGNWTVVVEYANYTGDLEVAILAAPEPVPEVAPAENNTAQLDEGKKESPGLGIPLVLLMVALFAIVRRRQ